MAYAKQTFTANTILTSTQMNNVENNISDHVHGLSGLGDVAASWRVTSLFSVGSHQVTVTTSNHSSNLSFGYSSCRSLAPGVLGNVAFGPSNMTAVCSGSYNNAFGLLALNVNVGDRNNAFGWQSQLSVTSGNNNSSFGHLSLAAGAIPGNCSAFGYEAQYNGNAVNNSAFGYRAMYGGIGGGGAQNLALASFALFSITTGASNVSAGHASGYFLTTGSNNVFDGVSAGQNVTTGSRNTFIGASAGNDTSTTSLSTALGYAASVSSRSNATSLGANTSVTGDSQVQLGDSATTTYAYGAVQNRSDARDKTDVRCTVLGLQFINALTAVDFRWDFREDYKKAGLEKDGSLARKRYHHGLIAQQVKAVCDSIGVDFAGYQDHKKAGGDDVLSIGYGELIAPLIRAVQELTERVKALEGVA